jgi:hypothetical protein
MGEIHSLTSYVMNYLSFLYVNVRTYATEIFPDSVDRDENGDVVLDDSFPPETETPSNLRTSSFSLVILWLLDVLCKNLEAKARDHPRKDESHFFLTTNIYYVIRKVKMTSLREIVGDSWIRQKVQLVRKHASAYQKYTWKEFLELVDPKKVRVGGEQGRMALKVRKKSKKQKN